MIVYYAEELDNDYLDETEFPIFDQLNTMMPMHLRAVT